MLLKLVRNSIAREKVLFFILLVFITTASFLVSTSLMMLTQLNTAISDLMERSSAPDFIQLHQGELDTSPIVQWASSQPLIKDMQIVRMVRIDGSAVYLGNTGTSESHSVMSFDFVEQNQTIDRLLDLSGHPTHVAKGEIAVPIYFMQQNQLEVGDKVRVVRGDTHMDLTIVSFIRDALMNPALVHSKRFVLSHDDFANISGIGTPQHLIEFRLTQPEMISAFTNSYQMAGLPQNGPTIDYRLLKVLHAVTDGMVIGILMLMSLLLIVVALLCLKFTISTAIEEDYRQIGVMKALGIPATFMSRVYLLKYTTLSATACEMGFFGSIGFRTLFTAHMEHYLGIVPAGSTEWLLPLFGVVMVGLAIVGFCALVLRRIRSVSVIDTFRASSRENQNTWLFSIKSFRFFNLNAILALRDLAQRSRLFLFLCLVFCICILSIVLPLNFLNTLQSPSFIRYMGISPSEMRIDLHQGNNHAHQLQQIITYLKQDKDVEEYSIFTTSRFKALHSDGASEAINVETGDFSHFPIDLLSGNVPVNEKEIALSYLNSKQLKKSIGDTLKLLVEGEQKTVTICGIYQDITNGGLTAKALFQYDSKTVLWHVINVNFKSGIASYDKINTYRQRFPSARVTKVSDYLAQTIGHLLKQVKAATWISMTTGMAILALIASFFFRMLIAIDARKIAIMKAIGFSTTQIQAQYMMRALFILNLSLIAGMSLSSTLGEKMISLILSTMGAPAIKLIIAPIEVYLFCPIILTSIVLITLWLTVNVRQPRIVHLIVE